MPKGNIKIKDAFKQSEVTLGGSLPYNIGLVVNCPDLMESLSPLGKQLRERLQRDFRSWGRFERDAVLGDELATLEEEIFRNLEKQLDTLDYNKDEVGGEDRMVRYLYALLGTVRSLTEAMAERQGAIGQIN